MRCAGDDPQRRAGDLDGQLVAHRDRQRLVARSPHDQAGHVDPAVVRDEALGSRPLEPSLVGEGDALSQHRLHRPSPRAVDEVLAGPVDLLAERQSRVRRGVAKDVGEPAADDPEHVPGPDLEAADRRHLEEDGVGLDHLEVERAEEDDRVDEAADILEVAAQPGVAEHPEDERAAQRVADERHVRPGRPARERGAQRREHVPCERVGSVVARPSRPGFRVVALPATGEVREEQVVVATEVARHEAPHSPVGRDTVEEDHDPPARARAALLDRQVYGFAVDLAEDEPLRAGLDLVARREQGRELRDVAVPEEGLVTARTRRRRDGQEQGCERSASAHGSTPW